ncbi:MAG: PIN domain-containing protein [Cellulomonadaceae bacterium]|jgi:predicted nucleic acid-binding protein|nr:PIN domain-containing protein [Cellulomonadaceae bacterium]
MASFTVVLDACVLVPVALADTLLRLAERDLFRPIWSSQILAETRAAIRAVHPHLDPSRIDARLGAMDATFTDASAHGWEPLVEGITLPDSNDRHVVAAAISGRAQAIVTRNLKDFPPVALEPHGLHAIGPDDFLLDLFDLRPHTVLEVLQEQAKAMRRPPLVLNDLLDSLAAAGAPQFTQHLRSAGTPLATRNVG